MRAPRVVAGLTAVVTAVLGLSLVTASPAAAATGSWRPYGNTNPITSSSSTWSCAATQRIVDNVGAQVCAIRSPSGTGVQAAVIVRNNRSSLYSAAAWMDLADSSGSYLGDWECKSSGVAANSWSVCFGPTFTWYASVNSAGYTNGVDLGISPWV